MTRLGRKLGKRCSSNRSRKRSRREPVGDEEEAEERWKRLKEDDNDNVTSDEGDEETIRITRN